ncbi:MAG: sporulation protein YabP [Bacilli bacterium]|nr:sporulation protein YabP [Bacilli bacterium]
MDKIDSSAYNHTITLVERKSFVTSGVKKIENFDDTQFLMDTVMGFLLVKGEGLELVKLDTIQGNVSIKGTIMSMTYLDESSKHEKESSLFNRLFR